MFYKIFRIPYNFDSNPSTCRLAGMKSNKWTALLALQEDKVQIDDVAVIRTDWSVDDVAIHFLFGEIEKLIIGCECPFIA